MPKVRSTLASPKIAVFGCRHNTKSFIDNLLRGGLQIALIITIDASTAKRNGVGGYADLKSEFPEIETVVCGKYNLSTLTSDHCSAIASCDLAFSIGWQRIIPAAVLGSITGGVFGMHACALRLPSGRGRSPVTWGLIHGCDRVQANIFRYTEDFDDGPIYSALPVEVVPLDTINTLQQRLQVVFAIEARRIIDDFARGALSLHAPSAVMPDTHYPKRSPSDGGLDLRKGMREITDFVRAQTRPYPGAFVMQSAAERRIWAAQPFPLPFSDLATQPEVGFVLEVFVNGSIAVACGDGFVLFTDHDIDLDTLTIPFTFCTDDRNSNDQ